MKDNETTSNNVTDEKVIGIDEFLYDYFDNLTIQDVQKIATFLSRETKNFDFKWLETKFFDIGRNASVDQVIDAFKRGPSI